MRPRTRLQSAAMELRGSVARALVACSGGADSTLLARLVAESGVPARLVHVHHHWRPAAVHEEAHVRALGRRLGLPVQVVHLRPDPGGEGREAGARAARYGWLARLARSDGSTVLTGHHAGDRLETLVMRLREGSGLAGLAGLPAWGQWEDVPVHRPLVGWWRDQIVAALEAADLGWCEDPGNADPAGVRADVRHRVVPVVVAGASREALTRSLGLLHRDREALEVLLAPWLERSRAGGADGAARVWHRRVLADAPPAVRAALVRTLSTEAGLPRVRQTWVDDLVRVIPGGEARTVQGYRCEARVEGDRVMLRGPVAPGTGRMACAPGRGD